MVAGVAARATTGAGVAAKATSGAGAPAWATPLLVPAASHELLSMSGSAVPEDVSGVASVARAGSRTRLPVHLSV